MAITGFNKVGHLLSGLCINNSAESRLPTTGHANHSTRICNYPYLNATDSPMSTDHFLGKIRLELVEMPIIQDAPKHLPHVVGLSMIFRQQLIQVRLWTSTLCLHAWRNAIRSPGSQLRYKFANLRYAI